MKARPDGTERVLIVTARTRGQDLLRPDSGAAAPPDPAVAELAALADADGRGPLWLGGGEPCLRADLPELVLALHRAGHRPVGLVTDGLALALAAAVAPIVGAGVVRARITLHAARLDAHDWLVGLRGAGRRALRAIRTCRAAGLEVQVAATLARSTAPHVVELVELAAALGATTLHLALPILAALGDGVVRVAPRLALLAPELEAAAAHASQRGLGLVLHGLPDCVAPQALGNARRPDPVLWLVPEGEGFRSVVAARSPTGATDRCSPCSPAGCVGIESDYTRAFGASELPLLAARSAAPGTDLSR